MGKSNEITVCSIYVSSGETGYIIHRIDLADEYKKEIIHELELLLNRITKGDKE